MNKYIKSLALGLMLALGLGGSAFAQSTPISAIAAKLAAGDYVTGGYQAISTETLVLLRYVGTNANGGTVTVAASGDITFSQGAVGGSTADNTMECDSSIAASGSRNGIYDLSTPDAQCDTVGEIVDLINSQGSNWRAVIIDGLRSDPTDNIFITRAETAANTVAGVNLLADGTTLFKQTFAVIPAAARRMDYYLVGGNGRFSTSFKTDGGASTVLSSTSNPFKGLTPILFQMTSSSTYTGTSVQQILCVASTLSGSATGGSEVVTTAQRTSGATTVETSWTQNTNFGTGCPTGQKMLVRTNNGTNMSVAAISAAGVVY